MNFKDIIENARAALTSHGIEVTAEYGEPLTSAAIEAVEATLGMRLPTPIRQLYLDIGDGLHFVWDLEGSRNMGYFELMPLKDLIKEHKTDIGFREGMVKGEDNPNTKRVWASMLKWIDFHSEGNGDTFALDTSRDPHPVVFNQHDWNDGGDETNGFVLGDDLNSFMIKWGSLCFQRPKGLWWPSVRKDFRVDWESDEFSKALTISGLAQSNLFIEPNPDRKARRRLSELIAIGDLAKVRQAITDGIKIESQNEAGQTALHEAAIWEEAEIVEFLIRSGADVNIRNKNGQTPLMSAASCAYQDNTEAEECMQVLLQHGADATAIDDEGRNALDHLRQYYRNPKMETLLKKLMKK